MVKRIVPRNVSAYWIVAVIFVTAAQGQSITGSVNGKTFGFSAGLGVTLLRATDVVDYITSSYAPPSRLDDFATAAEFYLAPEILLNESWGFKFEYAYLLKSSEVSLSQGVPYSYSYGIHMPTALAQYLVLGQGYAFKFGGGIGYHFASYSDVSSPGGSREYHSTGIGLKLEAEGNTAFDDHLFAYIGVDARDNIMGELKDSKDNRLFIASRGSNAKMSFFSIGLKLGFTYYF